MVKKCYCSEIMVRDLHVNKVTKIIHICFKKTPTLYCKGKWDKTSTKHLSSFVLLITISQRTAQPPFKSNPLSGAASFPVFLFRFDSIWNSKLQPHTLKTLGAANWNHIQTTSSSFGDTTHRGKNPTVAPAWDKVPLLRRKQHHCLNKVISFLSTHIILCQEAQLLYVYLRSSSPVSFTDSSFSLLCSSSPKHRFRANIPSLCSFTLLDTSSPFQFITETSFDRTLSAVY